MEDGDDFVRWLPCLGTEHAQAHRAFVIVADVRVVDFGFEAYYWRLKRIFSRKCQSELKVTALSGVCGQQSPGRIWGLGPCTHGVKRLFGTIHQDLPFSHVLFIEVYFHPRRGVVHAFSVLLCIMLVGVAS